MQLIFDIPDEKFDELKAGFIRCSKVPVDIEGKPTMSELAWMREDVLNYIFRRYQTGKQLKAQDAVVIDNNIIS